MMTPDSHGISPLWNLKRQSAMNASLILALLRFRQSRTRQRNALPHANPRCGHTRSALGGILAGLLMWLPAAPGAAQYAGIDTGSSILAPVATPDAGTQPLPVTPAMVAAPESDALKPFGANLFTGGFATEKRDGVNPDYVISPGDRIELRVWGATEINDMLAVDPKGNIFIPKVGPVHVAGARNDELNTRVTSSVRKVYTENVQVYTSLSSTQPIAVFVTGFVKNPGRYAGVASNSILYFIDRAAGIDPDRGSYRRVDILRNQKVIATADLYDFLLSGKLPTIQLRDGDTVLIQPRGNTVSVEGDVRNAAIFELTEGTVDGTSLLAWARPLASATHVVWSGVRAGAPNTRYLGLASSQTEHFADGDKLSLLSDAHQDVITVKVEGVFEGPSQFIVGKNARLGELLDMISVPEDLAAYEAISIRRQSILEQQKKIIEESLRQLESAYLRASSQTDEEATVRMVEARLIADFVQRVRGTEPTGRLVLQDPRNAKDLRLQNGDVITIPERTETIMISGEILIPRAILYNKKMSLDQYISQSGGFTESANTETILILRQNGEVVVAADSKLTPGDHIFVLPKVPSKYLQVAKELVDVVYKVAVSAGVLVRL